MSKRTTVGLIGLVCFLLGSIVSQQVGLVYGQEKVKGAAWLYGLELKSRKAGENDFSNTTKKYGFEVFKDENNGNIIYVSETGSIAVVPGK